MVTIWFCYFFGGHFLVVVADPFESVVGERADRFRLGFLYRPVLDANLLADLVIGQVTLLSCGLAGLGRTVGRSSQLGQIWAGQFERPTVGGNAQDEFVGRRPVEQVNLNRRVLNS